MTDFACAPASSPRRPVVTAGLARACERKALASRTYAGGEFVSVRISKVQFEAGVNEAGFLTQRLVE